MAKAKSVELHWLIRDALDAIEAERPELAGWCADKRREEAGGGRYEALSFVCSSLDAGNREIVAGELGIAPADLDACRRVLCKI